jgi:hypothetical protein
MKGEMGKRSKTEASKLSTEKNWYVVRCSTKPQFGLFGSTLADIKRGEGREE